MKPLLLVLAALLLLGGDTAPTASELNTDGYRLYKQEKYVEAVQKFEGAIAADATHVLAHYNLACTLAILRTKPGGVCEHDAYAEVIVGHLQEAVRLDPARRKRAAEDPDLVSVHDTYGFQRLIGRDPTVPADLRKILTEVTWWGPSPGVWGPTSGADFRADGSAELWFMDRIPESPDRTVRRGRWSLDGSTVVLQLEGKTWRAELDDGGRLRFGEGPMSFVGEPDECSA